jgi:hypothetical protein
MANEDNLIDISKRPDHHELSVKGGKSRSPRKLFQSTVNIMLANPKLTDNQKYLYLLLRDKEFAELITELIGRNLQDVDNPKRRDKVIEQLGKFMPEISLRLEANSRSVPFETYVKLRSAVMQVCTYEQFRKILDIIGEEKNEE